MDLYAMHLCWCEINGLLLLLLLLLLLVQVPDHLSPHLALSVSRRVGQTCSRRPARRCPYAGKERRELGLRLAD